MPILMLMLMLTPLHAQSNNEQDRHGDKGDEALQLYHYRQHNQGLQPPQLSSYDVAN